MPTTKKSEGKNQSLFWAPARQYNIANWVKEKKDHGEIIQPEQSLCFTERIFVCDLSEAEGRKQEKFIKASKGFKNGTIKLCADMREAMLFTQQVMVRKKRNIVESEIDLEDLADVKVSDGAVTGISSANV